MIIELAHTKTKNFQAIGCSIFLLTTTDKRNLFFKKFNIYAKEKTMEQLNNTQKSIDEYISKFPQEIQEILQTLRNVIKEVVPNAVEKISYGMPTFALNGNLVHFAAYKNHIGFYPTSSGINTFKEDLLEYKTSKGAVQFPIGKPIPYELIKKIVEFRVNENINKAAEKKKKFE